MILSFELIFYIRLKEEVRCNSINSLKWAIFNGMLDERNPLVTTLVYCTGGPVLIAELQNMIEFRLAIPRKTPNGIHIYYDQLVRIHRSVCKQTMEL
jgi:hypothetical protein